MAWGAVGVFSIIGGTLGIGGWLLGVAGGPAADPAEVSESGMVEAVALAAPAGYRVDPMLLDPRPMFPIERVALAQQAEPAASPPVAQAEPIDRIPLPIAAHLPDPAKSAKPAAVHPPKEEGGFTLADISRLKAALNLTPEQRPMWEPVEAALREIVAQRSGRHGRGHKAADDLSPELIQKLYFAASPLLPTLREDQKREVRKLARTMGLTKVASLI